jgi:EamA-like transporter family
MRPGQINLAQASRGAAATRLDRLALAAAGVTAVLWASAFVAIRSAGHYFSPGAMALGRLLPGAMVLGLVSLGRREGWPPRAAWPGIAAAGVLWFGVYTVALNWGEQKVDALCLAGVAISRRGRPQASRTPPRRSNGEAWGHDRRTSVALMTSSITQWHPATGPGTRRPRSPLR